MKIPEAIENRSNGQLNRFSRPGERDKRSKIAKKQMLENGTSQLDAMRTKNEELNKNSDHRKRYGDGSRGKEWYRRGAEEHRFDSHPGEGWELGRVPKYWWNNGVKQVYQPLSPGEGWNSGLLKRSGGKT
jgi:hypothetical protein